jgi:hypothetical protein
MKTIQKISALLAASATLSMAGVINVYTDDAKKATASLNLTTIDSLTFSGKAEKKEMGFSGKTKQKAIKLSDIDRMEFKLKDKSKETMTVTVGEGIMEGTHTFNLSEIKKIEIVEMDSEDDMDEDGLTDLEEIYKYDTNPKAADTDGDGWSDMEELGDGMYSPTNPTKFNPRIADVPGLSVTLKKSPSIMLNVTTSEGKTESETITEGREVSKTTSTSYEQTRSADIMNAWELSTTQGWEVEFDSKSKFGGAKYTGSVTVGYNGSYTSSTGMTWGGSEENSVTQSYEKAIAKEKSEGSEINGATLCMQVELKNTSDIAFTIEALKLSASTYDMRDSSTLKILADLNREGDWSDITLKPGQAVDANFCNGDVKVKQIENLIYNTSSIVLGTASQKITIGGGNDDFTVAYTKVAAKTADIVVDYGPGSTGKSSVRYQVATNYRYNLDHKGTDDMYAKTTLAELLRNAHVNFKQDTVVGPEKKKFYGLASIEGYKFNLADSAMWYVTIQRAADIKKGLNTVDIYSFSVGSYDLEKVSVGAGDAVHIFYSKDQDHDGLPLVTEHQFATSDTTADTDGDGLTDYDEITGWTQDGDSVKIYTSPTNEDTDGDGMNDKEDPEPTKRPMFKDASLFKLQVFADSLMVDSTALLSNDSAALVKDSSFKVFVQAPIAYIKIKPNAKKVSWVKFTATTNMTTMQYVQPDADGVYSFKTPGGLTITKNSSVKIEVRSEDEATTKIYTLSISSALRAPTGLKLGKTADRGSIIVNYTRPNDSRVKGYVILRDKKNYQDGHKRGEQLPDTITVEKGATIKHDEAYDKFHAFVIETSDSSRYVDGVGRGAPYYCYRVFAYTIEGDSANPVKVLSKGTEEKFRNVGRLHLKIRLFDWGGEYNLVGVHRSDIWSDIRLYNAECGLYDPITSWHGHDYMAGLSKTGRYDEVVFLSEVLDKEDEMPAGDTREYSIGKDGMCLEINVTADYPDGTDFTKKIRWNYSAMVNDDGSEYTYGTGQSGSAPKNGENRFLVGDGSNPGIKYDDTNGVCGSVCGGDIHAGYKFDISYDWDNDEAFY